jgi:hypothetical protein
MRGRQVTPERRIGAANAFDLRPDAFADCGAGALAVAADRAVAAAEADRRRRGTRRRR